MFAGVRKSKPFVWEEDFNTLMFKLRNLKNLQNLPEIILSLRRFADQLRQQWRGKNQLKEDFERSKIELRLIKDKYKKKNSENKALEEKVTMKDKEISNLKFTKKNKNLPPKEHYYHENVEKKRQPKKKEVQCEDVFLTINKLTEENSVLRQKVDQYKIYLRGQKAQNLALKELFYQCVEEIKIQQQETHSSYDQDSDIQNCEIYQSQCEEEETERDNLNVSEEGEFNESEEDAFEEKEEDVFDETHEQDQVSSKIEISGIKFQNLTAESINKLHRLEYTLKSRYTN